MDETLRKQVLGDTWPKGRKETTKVNLSHSTGPETGLFNISILQEKQEGSNVLESRLKKI